MEGVSVLGGYLGAGCTVMRHVLSPALSYDMFGAQRCVIVSVFSAGSDP